MILDDMVRGGLIGIISVLVALVFLSSFGASGRGVEPRRQGDRFEMTYSRGFKTFSVGLCVLSAICVIGILGREFHDKTNALVFYTFLALMVIVSIVVVREAFETHVVFDQKEVNKQGPWGESRISWIETTKVAYSGNFHAFELQGPNSRLRVSVYMVGLTTFLRCLDKNVSKSALVDVRDSLYQLLH
jgi:uncharacterized membrane protein